MHPSVISTSPKSRNPVKPRPRAAPVRTMDSFFDYLDQRARVRALRTLQRNRANRTRCATLVAIADCSVTESPLHKGSSMEPGAGKVEVYQSQWHRICAVTSQSIRTSTKAAPPRHWVPLSLPPGVITHRVVHRGKRRDRARRVQPTCSSTAEDTQRSVLLWAGVVPLRRHARPPPPDAWLKQGPHASGPLTRGSQGDHESAPGTASRTLETETRTSRPGRCDARKCVSNRGVGRAARGRSA